jgi:hypothetical protein
MLNFFFVHFVVVMSYHLYSITPFFHLHHQVTTTTTHFQAKPPLLLQHFSQTKIKSSIFYIHLYIQTVCNILHTGTIMSFSPATHYFHLLLLTQLFCFSMLQHILLNKLERNKLLLALRPSFFISLRKKLSFRFRIR